MAFFGSLLGMLADLLVTTESEHASIYPEGKTLGLFLKNITSNTLYFGVIGIIAEQLFLGACRKGVQEACQAMK